MTSPNQDADAGIAVDLALVLAVDCSSSIDLGDFKLQMDGIAGALRHPALARAIASGAHGRIALALVLWSNAETQVVAVPWRALGGNGDLEAAAAAVASTDRNNQRGGTGLAVAIGFSTAVLSTLPVPTARRVIDVSGDGEDNEGGDVAAARDLAVARGITINGLPIVTGSPTLVGYYQRQVIGGEGAFLEPAKNIASFRDTILRKLLREIGAPSA